MQSHVDEDSSIEVTEMKDPESRTIFAGVDGRTDTELTEWYRQRHGEADPVTFAEAVRYLPQSPFGSRIYKALRGNRGGR
jgi:hypothetical protein